MARLIVTAEASPLFGDFLMVVSVSNEDGTPREGFGKGSFEIRHLPSFNHAHAGPKRTIQQIKEAPAGFYVDLC